jgi:hypothetical protein
MATPKLSLVKSDVHHLGKKPLPEIHFHILKSEIRGLWREGRKNRYELGKKCKQLQDERAHAKNGTYMRDLAEMRIPYHTAQRAIKFYARAKKVWKTKLLQLAKDKKWLDEMGIEDVDELDRLEDAQQADARLAALVDIRDKAIEQVMHAVSKRKEQPSGHRVVLSLSDGQKQKFRKAWQSLGENEATSIVYKAVLNAAKEN